jgi:uncharacterized membrane protein YdjX (TVP38/TMEM64 family)
MILFGLIITAIGVVFLLQNLGLITGDFWSIFGPCLLIVVGFGIVFKRKSREQKWEKFGKGMKKFGEKMEETFGEKEKEK